MRTSGELNRAVARLRRVNRAAAEQHAQAYAEALLPDAARRRNVADLAALAIVSLALYGAAATCEAEEHGFRTVRHIVDRWYALLREGKAAEHVFAQDISYPEGLEGDRRDLVRVPALLLAAGVSAVRDAVLMLG